MQLQETATITEEIVIIQKQETEQITLTKMNEAQPKQQLMGFHQAKHAMRAKPLLGSRSRSPMNNRAGMGQGRAALPPALAPPQLQPCSQQNHGPGRGTEPPMLVTPCNHHT